MSETMNIMRCVKDAESAQTRDEAFALFEAAENGIAALEGERDALRVYAELITAPARELLDLYDLRPRLSEMEAGDIAAWGKLQSDTKAALRQYGERKKAGWIALRAALAKTPATGALASYPEIPDNSFVTADASSTCPNEKTLATPATACRNNTINGSRPARGGEANSSVEADQTDAARHRIGLRGDPAGASDGANQRQSPAGVGDHEPSATNVGLVAATHRPVESGAPSNSRHQSCTKSLTPRCDMISHCAASEWEKISRQAALAHELERERHQVGNGPTWADGMERAAGLCEEEAESARLLIQDSPNAPHAAKDRIASVRDSMALMAKTIRAFKAEGPELRHVAGKKSWSCPADPHGCTNKIQCERQGWCEVAGPIERIEFAIGKK